MEDLLNNHKKISYSGDGASYQNGVEERSIKTVVDVERTMLMHTALRYTEEKFPTDIWKIEMDYAVLIYNHIPHINSCLSTIEICSRSRF